MGLLLDNGVDVVSHYTPLHYLPFIERSKALRSKPALLAAGFVDSHFRSKSKRHDVGRGFGNYTFLTLDSSPRIVRAKLAGGFPHIAILVPAAAIEDAGFELCRFNVAMTRRLRRGATIGWSESSTNGRYYGQRQVPVARTSADVSAMLGRHLGKTMIEVLVRNQLALPDDTTVVAYHPADHKILVDVLDATNSPWKAALAEAPGPYPRKATHVRAVQEFVDHAIADDAWRGNGLEFDRV